MARSTAKPAAAKPVAKKPAATNSERVPATRKLDLAFALKERKKGTPLHAIADEMGAFRGTVGFILRRHDVQTMPEFAKLRITGTPAAVAKAIVRARDVEGVSWVEIASRADIEYDQARQIYAEAKGLEDTRGLTVPGKGGRPIAGSKAPVKKTTAKKAPVKQAPATKVRNKRRVARRPS